MKPQPDRDAAALRRAAEAALAGRPAGGPRSEADLRRLQHELEVHQIELEMQNEELRAARTELEAALERYTDLYDFAPVGYLTLDREGIIRAANLTGAGLLAADRAGLLDGRLSAHLQETDRPAFHAFLSRAFASGQRESCELTVPRAGQPALFVRLEAVAASDGRECRIIVFDFSQRHQTEVERDELIGKLRHALAQVKQLSGLLPICANCKKIRDDRGYWNALETFISSHSEATFTHGLCPACAAEFLHQLDLELPRPPGPPG